MPSTRSNPLPERLRQARSETGLTQEQVAARAGLTYNSISRYENGAAYPSQLALNMLASLYGKPVEWFFGEGDQRQPEPESKAEQSPIEADRELVMNEASLALRSTGKELSDEAIRSIADFIRFMHAKERRESQSGS